MLTFPSKSGIISTLNQLNNFKRHHFSMGILYPFCLLHSEFDKNANSACKRQGDLVISSWFSDLEFAFFVRGFGRALFILTTDTGEKAMKHHKKDNDTGNELFKQAINEALARKFDKEIEASPEPVEFSDRHKRWMNNFFRNVVGCKNLPYPEMDDDQTDNAK